MLDQSISHRLERPEIAPALGVDKTIAAHDGNAMFWGQLNAFKSTALGKNPLQDLFSGPLLLLVGQSSYVVNEEAVDSTHFEDFLPTGRILDKHSCGICTLLAMLLVHRHVYAICRYP